MTPGADAVIILGSGMFLGASTCLVFFLDRIERARQDSEQLRIAASITKRRLASAEKEIERLTEQADDLLGSEEASLRKLLK
jgi:hypothetical protein